MFKVFDSNYKIMIEYTSRSLFFYITYMKNVLQSCCFPAIVTLSLLERFLHTINLSHRAPALIEKTHLNGPQHSETSNIQQKLSFHRSFGCLLFMQLKNI